MSWNSERGSLKINIVTSYKIRHSRAWPENVEALRLDFRLILVSNHSKSNIFKNKLTVGIVD